MYLEKFLPEPERQLKKYTGTWACTNFAPASAWEIKFNELIPLISDDDMNWLNEHRYIVDGKFNFSDRFNAILSGTQWLVGNNIHTSIKSILEDGFIPEWMLDFPENLLSADEYYDLVVITQEMRDLGKEFLRRFPNMDYERVLKPDFDKVLETDPIMMRVNAWYQNKETKQYYNPRITFNHYTVVYGKTDTAYKVFDSLPPELFKDLELDYNFYFWAYIPKINYMENQAKIFKDKNSASVYIAMPILNEEAFKSLCLNFGKKVKFKDDEVDWDGMIEGEIELK